MADTSVPLTAEELHTLVRDFPEDAKPKWRDAHTHYYLSFQAKEWYVIPSFGEHISPLHPDHAAALFRDSGLEWLLKSGNVDCLSIYWAPGDEPFGYSIEIDEFQEKGVRRTKPGFARVTGETLLLAISAAIKRVGGEG